MDTYPLGQGIPPQPPDCLPFHPLADARRLCYGPHMWLSRDGHGAGATGFNE